MYVYMWCSGNCHSVQVCFPWCTIINAHCSVSVNIYEPFWWLKIGEGGRDLLQIRSRRDNASTQKLVVPREHTSSSSALSGKGYQGILLAVACGDPSWHFLLPRYLSCQGMVRIREWKFPLVVCQMTTHRTWSCGTDVWTPQELSTWGEQIHSQQHSNLLPASL